MSKLLAVILFTSAVAAAQNSTNSWDTGIWFAGGHSVPGGTSGVSVFDAGLRLGKVLTGDHGPVFLRGNFQYSIDLVPIYLIHQPEIESCVTSLSGTTCTHPTQTVYGGGFNPINLKWNFTAAKHVIPYLELGGGTLFSTQNVPAGTNDVNFRTHASLGAHLWSPASGGARGITVEVRYEHISNAGLASPNPGVNTLQFLAGFNIFTNCVWFHRCHPI